MHLISHYYKERFTLKLGLKVLANEKRGVLAVV
jgi:hypothetical protein